MNQQPNRRIRQTDLVPENILETPITIVGAGSIGSFTTLALAKCGFNDLTVYDYDKIEEHNIPNQFYPLKYVGRSKVKALLDMVKLFEDIDVYGIEGVFPGAYQSKPTGIVISAVDTMTDREEMFKSIRRNKLVTAFIDGRMGGQQLEVYTTKMNNVTDKTNYQKTLWSEEEADDARCTEKAVIYNVLIIAGMIVNQCRLVLSDKEYLRQIIMHLDTMQMIKVVK